MVDTWEPSYKLNRGKSFVINDKFKLLENKRNNSLHFMTTCNAIIDKPGVVRLDGEGFVLEITYSPFVLELGRNGEPYI